MKTLVMAIDVGASGAVVGRYDDGSVFSHKMPETRGDLVELLTSITDGAESVVCYIEKVVSYIPKASPSAMFNYGVNCERPFAILQTLGVKIIEVRPKEWQKELGLGGSDRLPLPKPPKELTTLSPAKVRNKAIREWEEAHRFELDTVQRHNDQEKRKWKGRLKEVAQQRFPTVKVTLINCDALLILEASSV